MNFVDHGAPGFVAFPNYPQGEVSNLVNTLVNPSMHVMIFVVCLQLTAQQLNQAIQSMHSQNKFKQMVVYIEACESGSMFDGLLPTDINGETSVIRTNLTQQ